MIALLILTGLVAAGMMIGLYAATSAPVGYQDEAGFHYGADLEVNHEEVACGVSEPELV